MTENGRALAALNAEARRQKTTYGELVGRLSQEEQKKIIRKYETAMQRRGKRED